jgi:Acetyltransferase (GNAT) family.
MQKIFRETVNVSINNCESLVFVMLSIKGAQISKMKCILQEDNSLLVGDIEPFKKRRYYNKGYGSKMMNKLLEYASDNKICAIHGNLSVVDQDHKERLHHFYEKHGFEIVLFKEPNGMYYGKVVKKL